ncbi:protein phosphatase 2C domain-containing protein [Kiritimatiellaeota bacterium B1221]|nr:protein phosphatase 2C domain-containing protein [Kiritimatiellaeota bacterium B1221]
MSEQPPGMVNPVQFRIFSRTDVGKRRQRNEDSLGVIARYGVFLVADGMGGVDGGDFSSQQVVEQMTRTFQSKNGQDLSFPEIVDLVEKAIVEASGIIKKEAEVRGISGMGTTVVVICFDVKDMSRACVLHVGDSRLYRYRNRNLEALTQDHSLAAESGIKDTAMIPMFMAGVITRAVGVRDDVLVDRAEIEVKAGDLFLLCSDGLYNMVPDAQMGDILSLSSVDPAADLVNKANEAGGFDNITVIIVEPKAGNGSRADLDDTVM